MRKVIVTTELARRVEADPRYRAALTACADPDWRERAVCTNAPDPDLFFPAVIEAVEPARRLCRRCPVSGECLAEALGRAEIDGVWGGTTTTERRTMRAVWRRSRPCEPAAV